MACSIWKGSIAFGLVNIPVSLTSAERRPDIQLHMVDSKTHARIRYERVNADTGEEVPWDRLVRGYEYEDGRFILLSDEELEQVRPQLTKTIEITEFVALDDIDPLLFDKPYYLQPEKRGKKAYALLREALKKTGRAGISRVVIRTREYLSAMFARDEALILMLLRFPQEIVPISKLEIDDADTRSLQPSKKEMDLAVRLIGDMEEEWNPKLFHDEYRTALMDYVEKKIAGGDVAEDVKEGDDEEPESTNVINLAEYLERSFKSSKSPKAKKVPAKKATSKGHASKNTPAKKSRSKKSPAKKAAAKKTKRSA
ncbi:MAG: Ku protein [Verrucomicrobiales bacterium]|nr:Ku protein [Verrucomicrobiales bacterium]